MKNKLKLYLVNIKYVRDLSKRDSNVMSVSPQNGKDDRPFLGIVFPVDDNNKKYCIPLSSVKGKEKHKNAKSTDDRIYVRDLSQKDQNGANPAIGVLNVNNMIPVDECVLTPIDIKVYDKDTKSVKNNKIWRTKELDWCQKNADSIEKKVKKIYKLVLEKPEDNIRLVKRCCKFDVLEVILEKWKQKKHQNDIPHNKPHQQNKHTQSLNDQNSPKKRISLDSRIADLHKNGKSSQNQAKQQNQLRKPKRNNNNEIE